jgi:hypothetical protein
MRRIMDHETTGSRVGPSLVEQFEFPYAVVRDFTAVYRRLPVLFVDGDPERGPEDRAVVVNGSPPVQNQLTEHHRRRLVARLVELSQASGRRMCAVFGSTDVVYVESDGATHESVNTPRGGGMT